MNAPWSVRIDRLATQLRVGVYAHESEPQPVWVTLHLRGLAPAQPRTLDECIDYEPLCRWISEEWPRWPHTPLLETRINELAAFAFDFDDRVQEVHVGLAKERMSAGAASVGIERGMTRAEYEAQRLRMQAARSDKAASQEPGRHGQLKAAARRMEVVQ